MKSQSNKTKHQPKANPPTQKKQKTATRNKTAEPSSDMCQFMSQFMQEMIALYRLDVVWQKQREEQQNHQAIPEGE